MNLIRVNTTTTRIHGAVVYNALQSDGVLCGVLEWLQAADVFLR